MRPVQTLVIVEAQDATVVGLRRSSLRGRSRPDSTGPGLADEA